MKIHELAVKSLPKRTRVGRGISAGGGKTAGRGTKGQNARTGGGVRIGFEGGQNKLAKRLPKKRGFRALNHKEFQVVNLGTLEQFKAAAVVDAAALVAVGAVKSATDPIKVLGHGELTKKLTIKVSAASKSAVSKIEAVGGTIEVAVAAVRAIKRPAAK